MTNKQICALLVMLDGLPSDLKDASIKIIIEALEEKKSANPDKRKRKKSET